MTEKQKWLRKKLSHAERIGVIKRNLKTLNKELQWAKTLGGLSMNSSVISTMDQMSLEELEAFKTEVNEYIKTRKANQKEKAKVAFESNVSPGDRVLFMFKNEEVEGEVVKINEKSFTASFEWEEGIVKKPIQFHLYRGSVEESATEEFESEDEEVLDEVAF
jgi:hypothetical protein